MVLGVAKPISLREKLGLPEPRFMTVEQRKHYANACRRQFREKNPEAEKETQARYKRKHPHVVKERTAEWRSKNREWMAEYSREYHKDPLNQARRRATAREYYRKRRMDPAFRIAAAQRSRVWELVKLGKADRSISLGLTSEMLREHLARKFEPGMTWNNYGSAWHVDHVVPCCEFDLTKPAELRKCFALHNLQPAWAKVNLRKNRRLPVQSEMQLVA